MLRLSAGLAVFNVPDDVQYVPSFEMTAHVLIALEVLPVWSLADVSKAALSTFFPLKLIINQTRTWFIPCGHFPAAV